jgi:hypothetical protein
MGAIVDMHQHENFGHYRTLFEELHSQGYQVSRMHIDIACKVGPHLDKAGLGSYHRGVLDETSTKWSCCNAGQDAIGCAKTQFVVPAMHMLCHCESCQLEFGVLYQEGGVLCRCSGLMEHVWQVQLAKVVRTWSC